MNSFYASKSQKRKKDSQVSSVFCTFGILGKLLLKCWWNWPLELVSIFGSSFNFVVDLFERNHSLGSINADYSRLTPPLKNVQFNVFTSSPEGREKDFFFKDREHLFLDFDVSFDLHQRCLLWVGSDEKKLFPSVLSFSFSLSLSLLLIYSISLISLFLSLSSSLSRYYFLSHFFSLSFSVSLNFSLSFSF